jgi:hypothetical protein
MSGEPALHIRFVSGHDVERLAIGPDAVLGARWA